MKKAFLLYVLFHLSWSFSQITFYQDIYRGGVCYAGFSTGLGTGGGSFSTYIEPNSQIKKVFLIYNVHGEPLQNITITLDNVPITIVNDTYNNEKYFETQYTSLYKFGVNILDITTDFQNLPNHTIEIPNQDVLNCGLNCAYRNFSFVIFYENSLLEEVAVSLLINNQNMNSFSNNYQYQINAFDQSQPVGFSINSDIIANPNEGDGSFVLVEGQNIGLIGGPDNVNFSSIFGTRGHFYYQNNQLFGLDDDTPDTIMAESDALANVSNFLVTNNISWNLQWQNENVHQNIYSSFIFAYTSPCSEFATQTSSDTTFCFGSTAQLFAFGGGSGGMLPAYEWQPAVGLSCTDCPNPIVTADSSRLYTVRIRNNDSCSVVRPIKVNVKPLPEFSSVVSKPSICGAATGQILLGADYVGETYSINGGTLQTAGTFSNLSAGTYTVSLHELNGCTRDTLVVVGDTSLTQAYFTATPQSGAAPLWVQFSNQSTNANEFSWSVNGEPQGGNLTSFSFDTNGVYTVELAAWQFDPSCADTFSVLISVYDSLVVQIPNVFTPNHDGNNDFFGVTVNRPCEISFSILNRWGNIIQSGTVPTSGGFVPLWSGSNAPDGTYFYQIELQADDLKQVEKRHGFVELR